MKKTEFISKIHLIIAVVVVIPIAIIYGFELSFQLDISVTTIDEKNFFKSIMGIYIGFSIIWILGIFKARYFKLALITNMVFMFGLAFGRLLSLFLDGIPTLMYQLGTFAELFLGIYGLWILNRKDQSKI